MSWLVAIAMGLAGAVAYLLEHNARVGAERDFERAVARSQDAELSLRIERERTGRLEAVVTSLKADIIDLEMDNAACASPDAVRARLRRLLSFPPSGGIDAAKGAGPVPVVPSTGNS